LTRIKGGEHLDPREMGELHRLLTSGLGSPSAHGSAIVFRRPSREMPE